MNRSASLAINAPPANAAGSELLCGCLSGVPRQTRFVSRRGVAVHHALLHSLVDFRNRLRQERANFGRIAALERAAQILNRSAQFGAI